MCSPRLVPYMSRKSPSLLFRFQCIFKRVNAMVIVHAGFCGQGHQKAGHKTDIEHCVFIQVLKHLSRKMAFCKSNQTVASSMSL